MNTQNNYKTTRMNISLPLEIRKLLEILSQKTGHKYSKIIEKGIILFEKENK